MGSDRRSRSRSRSRDRPRRREREERGDRRERSRSRDRQRRNRSRSRDRKDRTGPSRDRGGAGGGGGGGNANLVPLGKDDGGFGLRNPGVKKEEPQEEVKEKEGINLGLSGALTKDVNTFNGIVIKYSEPPEARIPKRRWRFYQFKGEEVMPTLHIHRQSAYLIGRDRKVCDIPVDHPSCSKQHAAFQYRLVSKKKQDGTEGNRVLPYIIDLGSSNGTFLNNNRIEPQRYYELKEKDVIKFGYSTREYVLLHENSEDEA